MKVTRSVAGILGVVMFAVALWQLQPGSSEVEVVEPRSGGLPVTIMSSQSRPASSGPLVLVGHGLAGSRVIMHGFAVSLARAGYTVVLWDFAGHGANAESFPTEGRTWSLIGDAEAALATAARELGVPEQTAILGHSMGSGVALAFGQAYPDTAATIAVSPVAQAVTPELPRNLLLVAGRLEAGFVRNAEQRLAEAGGAGGNPTEGTARDLVIIPGVEHISILFSPAAHNAARGWLDATFGPQPSAKPTTDRRLLWYGVGLLGTLLTGWALAAAIAWTETPGHRVRPLWWRLGALVGGAVGATLLLWLLGLAGVALTNALGLLVGGYLLVWFGLAGWITALLLRAKPRLPRPRALLGGLAAFAVLWFGVGLLAEFVWLPWVMIPRRLLLWPLGAVLLLPWFLALGDMGADARWTGRVGWWLASSITLGGAMLLAMRLSPGLGFLMLLLPLFPMVLALQALAAAPYRGAWPFALSGALFTSWLVLAVFPLQ